MKNKIMMLCVRVQNLLNREEGQDLIEYALVVALVALAATAGMGTLATDINKAFTSIGTTLTGYTGEFSRIHQAFCECSRDPFAEGDTSSSEHLDVSPFRPSLPEEELQMKIRVKKLISTIQKFVDNQDGQDLIEYALVVALIAFAATASMSTLAGDINTAFTSIGTTLTGYTG